MGFASKLGAKNNANDQQLKGAVHPVSEAGYNQQNIPNLPSAPPMTQDDVTSVISSGQEARRDLNKAQPYSGPLQKPIPIRTGDQTRDQINSTIVDKMWRIISLNRIHAFYNQERLGKLVERACKHDYNILMKQWNIATMDMTLDLAVLGLYDIVLFGDDSGSMSTVEPTEDNMTRHQILQEVIRTLSFWSSLMDADGVVIRFMNSSYEGNGISDSKQVQEMFRNVRPGGGTPMGEVLKSKIIDGMIKQHVLNGDLERPFLIITVTDGIPNNPQAVVSAILEARNMCAQSKYGEHAIAFSFAQVGNDKSASDWLGEIDTHPQVGHLIDCTSSYPIEKQECMAKFGVEFTESMWLIKLMIGAVDPAYDQADEGTQPQQSQQYQQYQGGYQQPPSQGGYQQPPSQGGYQQPPSQGGYQQQYQGGYQQPPSQGGYQQPRY